MRSKDIGRLKKWGLSLHNPILFYSRKAKKVKLTKVYAICIVHNPGLQTKWFDELVCPLCAYYASAIINGTSFHYGVNDNLNNKFCGLSTYC